MKIQSSGYEQSDGPPKTSLANLWQRHKVLFTILAIAAVVLIIGLPIGLGVGLHDRNDSDNSSTDGDSSNTTTPSTNNTTANGSYWQPQAGTSWQIVLSTVLDDTSVVAEAYDIDLFINTPETIAKLHSLGRKVICYFSAGSYEDFRPDSGSFQKTDYGKGLDGWEGEWWLNTSSPNVRSIMVARMDLAVTKGCDGVDPDNVDGYSNDSGLDLTEDTAVDYLTFLADAAHNRSLAIGLKNGGSIVNRVVDMMQWDINEQCNVYSECDLFEPFIAADKPVFHIEYPTEAPDVSAATKAATCDAPSTSGFSTILKKMDLDAWVDVC